MAERFPYPDARAFRNALKDRFAVLASSDATYRVPELHRQFAYDRALARIFTPPDDGRWVLKGAGALLARLPGARHSKDVDIAYAAEAARSDVATNACAVRLIVTSATTFVSRSAGSHHCTKKPKAVASIFTAHSGRRSSPPFTSTSWSARR